MTRRFRMLLIVVLGPILIAAWPDSYPSRVQASAALRMHLAMPDLNFSEAEISESYERACSQGFGLVCGWQNWKGRDAHGDLDAAGAFFGPKCSGEPLACVVSGWAKSRVAGHIDSEASDLAGAVRIFTKGCKTDLYAPACTSLGELYQAGVGVGQDESQALQLFEEGCAAKDWWGCHLAGELLTDEEQSRDRQTRACENGIIQGCAAIAGTMIEDEPTKSAELFGQACQVGHMASCFEMGQLFAQGIGVQRVPAVASQFYQTACEGGELRGCYGLGTLYESGDGSMEQAVSFYDSACEAEYAPACSRLGDLYLRGNEVLDRNRDLGMRYIERGCDAGDMDGCVLLGQMYEGTYRGGRVVALNLTLAVKLYSQACESDDVSGCYELATLFLTGKGVAPDVPRGLDLLRKSCSAGDGDSCGSLGMRFKLGDGLMKNTREAIHYLQEACALQHGSSCTVLGDMLENGDQGLTMDPVAASEHYQQACALGNGEGCLQLGRFYQTGTGLQRNFVNAMSSYEIACEDGIDEACRAMEPIMFQAGFEGIIQDGFESQMCQVWGTDPEEPEGTKLLVEGQGADLVVHAGPQQNQTVRIVHLKNEFEGGDTRTARSFWQGSVDGQVLPNEIEHHEVWRTTQESADSFPGDESFSLEPSGRASIIYNRLDETLRYGEGTRCEFVDGFPSLVSEHCSELQALAAANLVSNCR